MPTEQYHEPPGELSPEIRTFARLLFEEGDIVGHGEEGEEAEKKA